MKWPQMQFFATLLFYFMLLLNPNNKTLIIFFLLYAIFQYVIHNNLLQALTYTYIVSLPIRVGKTYVVELLPAQLFAADRLTGVENFITISVQEILIVAILLLLIRKHLGKEKIFNLDNTSLILSIYFAMVIIASIAGSIRPQISIIHALYNMKAIIIYLAIRHLRFNKTWSGNGVIAIITATIFFISSLGMMQFLSQAPVGSSIEETSEYLAADQSPDAIQSVFRPVGTFSHANGLAHYLIPYFFLLMPMVFINPAKGFMLYTSGLAILGIILTLSRSAWISIFAGLMLFLYLVEKRYKYHLKFNLIAKRIAFIGAPIALMLTIFLVVPRLANSLNTFEINGSGATRGKLLETAFRTIEQHPLFGVGLGMDIFYAYQTVNTHVNSVLKEFPEAVHIGIVQHAQQTGIPATLLYIILSIMMCKKVLNNLSTKSVIIKKLALFAGFVAVYINTFFQPFLFSIQEMTILTEIYKDEHDAQV